MLLKQKQKKRPERDLNKELCNARAVLHQMSYRANWELVIMWVNDKPRDTDANFNQVNYSLIVINNNYYN